MNDDAITQLLLIDDDAKYRTLIRDVLGALFPSATLVETGDTEEARRHLDSQEYDCAIIDYRLVGATGIEIIEESSARDAPTGIGIVMLTGEGNEDIAVAALKAGAHDYLVKEALGTAALYRAIRGATLSARLARRAFLQREVLEGLSGMIAADLERPLRHLTDRLEGLLKAGPDAVSMLEAELTDSLALCRNMDETLRTLTFLTGEDRTDAT